MSREIHDNIGQKLTLAKLHLNTLDLLSFNNAAERLQTSVSLISDAITDLSDVSRSLSAEVIANNGLIKALELEVQQMRKSRLYNISLEINGEPVFLDSHRELIVFRIIQESLSNIMKHAAATLIKIKLNYTELLLQVNISDNGKGFSVNQPSASGTGIANMKRRAGWLKGVCLLDSVPGAGTNINIEIPLI
ncbi:MAG: histidine kinase [Ferruginibacter sp.]